MKISSLLSSKTSTTERKELSGLKDEHRYYTCMHSLWYFYCHISSIIMEQNTQNECMLKHEAHRPKRSHECELHLSDM